MYSTKRVHKNKLEKDAYITVGDNYKDPNANPFRQRKKGEKAPNPFVTKTIPQNEENGHFSKLRYNPEGYKETYKYITSQPLDSRKNGFGTKDASRRDEFSNNIRTEQMRENIRKENDLMNKGKDAMNARLTQLLATRAMDSTTSTAAASGGLRPHTVAAASFSYDDRCAQYDIGRNRLTVFDPKSSKDTYYKFDSDRDKRFGSSGSRPSSYDLGAAAWAVQYKPPQFGGKSLVKNFFDKSHLGVSYATAAATTVAPPAK